MDEVVSNSTTLAKHRSSLHKLWYVTADMVKGGHVAVTPVITI